MLPLTLSVAAPVFAQSSALVAHAPYPTGTATPLGVQIAALLADPTVSRAHWGIAVTALDGTPIYGLDEGKFFRPASNAKLFTTTAAMALLGPDATLTTTVVSGSLPGADGVLHDELVLKGAGDANLSGVLFPYETPQHRRSRLAGKKSPAPDPLAAIDALAASVAARGVTRITEAIVADDTLWPTDPYPAGWALEDQVWDYGAPVSALAVNDNTTRLTAMAPRQPGAPVAITLAPPIPSPPPSCNAMSAAPGSTAALDISYDIAGTLQVRGTLPAGSTHTEDLAVEDPAFFAAAALKERLQAHGVRVDGGLSVFHRYPHPGISFSVESHQPLPQLVLGAAAAAPCGRLPHCRPTNILASHTSPSLAEDVMYTMKESQNLHAEMLLRRLGNAFGEDGTSAQGARVLRAWLPQTGTDPDDVVLYDGSGLSQKDLITPRSAVSLLAWAATQPWFAAWKAALPVGGVDGTLANRFKELPLQGHVFAKTGTLGESRALSGYLDAANGRQLIFSILVDGHSPVAPADRLVMDRIVAAIGAAD